MKNEILHQVYPFIHVICCTHPHEREITGDEMKLLEQKLVLGNLIKKKFGLEYEATLVE